ncbi:hypothetical protein D3C71_1620800 [compost metagenome]
MVVLILSAEPAPIWPVANSDTESPVTCEVGDRLTRLLPAPLAARLTVWAGPVSMLPMFSVRSPENEKCRPVVSRTSNRL